ncbi:MAG: protoporphyrinogen oxidase [bacterium]|nr:protoporphyrinogen oxidase [bacterium]
MSNNSNNTVAIIGGGIAGLIAAYELIKRGKSVTLFEKNQLGGLIKSSIQDGFTIEQGATTLALTSSLQKLLNELNLDKEIIYPVTENYGQYVWWNNTSRLIPRGPKKMFRSDLLSVTEKLRLIKGLLTKPSQRILDENLSVNDFVTELFGKATAQKIAAPVTRGIFGGDTNELIAKLVFPKLFAGLTTGLTPLRAMKAQSTSGRPKIATLQGGNQTLCSKLENIINDQGLIAKSEVSELNYIPSTKSFSIKSTTQEECNFSSVFVATSAAATAPFIEKLDPATCNLLKEIKYAELMVLHFACKKSAKIPEYGFGLLFPKDNQNDLLGILYNSRIYPHVAPKGSDLITLSFGGVDGLMFEKESYTDRGNKVLKSLYDIHDAKLLSKIHWPFAIPQYDSICQQSQNSLTQLQYKFPGLFFIGADVGGVGVPSRIERSLDMVSSY